MNLNKLLIIGSIAGLTAGLAACGGSDSSDGSTTSKVVTGPITAFGSVYVNGTRYGTDNAKVYIEDSEGDESDLRVGMMVNVEVNADGSAKAVHYDDDLEGIVTKALENDVLMVMEQAVIINNDTVFESKVDGITDPSLIVVGNIVEVTGYSDGNGSVVATRIEVKAEFKADDAEVEVKGVVANHDPDGMTFTIGDLPVSYDGAVLDDMPAGNWDGLYVEVKSTQDLVDGQMIASKVELEDEGKKDGDHHGDENDEMEYYGEISELTDTSVTVNGKTFLLDAENTKYEHGESADLNVGVKIKIEGYVNANGELVAKEIEFKDMEQHNDYKEIEGEVASIEQPDANVNEGSIVVNEKTIHITTETIMHDDKGDTHFNLGDLVVGDLVEVHAFANDDGVTFTATKLEREQDKKEPAPVEEAKK